MGETRLEILLVIESELKIEVMKKYGNKLGTTKASQSLIPSKVKDEKSLFKAKIIEKYINVQKHVIERQRLKILIILLLYYGLKKNIEYVKIFLWIYLI